MNFLDLLAVATSYTHAFLDDGITFRLQQLGYDCQQLSHVLSVMAAGVAEILGETGPLRPLRDLDHVVPILLGDRHAGLDCIGLDPLAGVDALVQ